MSTETTVHESTCYSCGGEYEHADPTPEFYMCPECATATQLDLISWATRQQQEMSDRLAGHVHQARKAGATWAEIARHLGISVSLAHYRYGRT